MRTEPGTDGPDPDLPLVERFRSGDEGAFDDLVRRHQATVYRLLRTLAGSHEDADDLAQEVFLRAYRNLRGFEGRSSLKTWLTRIAINAALNHRKSWWVRHRSALEEEAAPAPGAAAPDALGGLVSAERQAELHGAIEELPDRQRETLRLVLAGGMKYAEIARAMGCTEGTVKANFFHAVQKLRRALAPGA